MREKGSRTHEGFWVMVRAAWAGFSVTRARWASSGVSDLPERTALKRSLDDFNTFGWMVGGDWGANSAKS